MRFSTLSPLCLLAVLFTSLPFQTEAAEEPAVPLLTFRSTDGKTFEGSVLSLENESVKVKRKDGREFTILLSRLTPETISEVQKATPSAAPAKSDEKAGPSPNGAPVAKVTKPDDIKVKVTVKLGEKVSAVLEAEGDAVTKATVVKTPDDKTPCFTVDFHEYEGTTTAISKHTFQRTLRVRCLVRQKGSKTWTEANIFPLFPGISGGDTWQSAEELVFFDFKFTDEKLE